jgi:hypothetical protein
MSLALLFACAHPMPPPGGPPDEIEPWLVAFLPDSGAVGVGPVVQLQFGFSEKMERTDAYRWLNIYPRRVVRGTSWKGARMATVRLEEPLPADTVVVVEVMPGMKDNHGVAQPRGRTFVFATGDSIPDGAITGSLVLETAPLGGGVVEILPDGPDTVRLAQRPVLRRAVADSSGRFQLPWLPASGERWLLRAYEDRNGDRRPGDNEAVRLYPDTLRLTDAAPTLDAGVRIVFKRATPGQLTGALAGRPVTAGPVLVRALGIAEDDTGFVAAPDKPSATPAAAVADTGAFEIPDAGPGLVRALFFVDTDGDSLFGAVGAPADTLWALEPWALVDSITVEPGLPAAVDAPVWPDTLTPWPAPPPPDTTMALPDSLATAPADTVAGAEE